MLEREYNNSGKEKKNWTMIINRYLEIRYIQRMKYSEDYGAKGIDQENRGIFGEEETRSI